MSQSSFNDNLTGLGNTMVIGGCTTNVFKLDLSKENVRALLGILDQQGRPLRLKRLNFLNTIKPVKAD